MPPAGTRMPGADRLGEIATAADTELLPIEGAGHNDLWYVGGSTYSREIGDRVRTWAGD